MRVRRRDIRENTKLLTGILAAGAFSAITLLGSRLCSHENDSKQPRPATAGQTTSASPTSTGLWVIPTSNFRTIGRRYFESGNFDDGQFTQVMRFDSGDLLLFGGNRDSILITKTHADGTVMWSRQMRNRGSNYLGRELATGAVEMPDGTPIVIGCTERPNGPYAMPRYHGLVMRFGHDGSTTWTRRLQGETNAPAPIEQLLESDECVLAVTRSSDNNLFVATRRHYVPMPGQTPPPYTQVAVYKLNAQNGSTMWSGTLSTDLYPRRIFQVTADTATVFGSGADDYPRVSDVNMGTLSSPTFFQPVSGQILQLTQLQTGGFIGTGGISEAPRLVRFDQNMQISWERTYPCPYSGLSSFHAVPVHNPEGFFALGLCRGNSDGGETRFNRGVRVDANGNRTSEFAFPNNMDVMDAVGFADGSIGIVGSIVVGRGRFAHRDPLYGRISRDTSLNGR